MLNRLDDPEPPRERFNSYYDDPIKVGIILAMVWAVIGMLFRPLGRVPAGLAGPDIRRAWASFGRLRPAHTTAVIFGFGDSALIATSFHVMQRTSRARLAGEFSPRFVLIGYQLFVILAVTGFGYHPVEGERRRTVRGPLAGRRLGDVFVLYMRTLARRNEPHIHVANWYYMAFILIVAVLHIFNNIAVPVSWGGSQSYILWSGV